MTREELIASLVTDRFSGFREGDEAILQAASDARLEEFRTNSEKHRTDGANFVRLEGDNRNVAARLKVAEDRLKIAEQPMSKADFLEKAPVEFKTLLENHTAQEEALRASLVSQLKDLGANTEEELKKKPVAELVTLAKYARLEVPDFSGRGLPVRRDAEDNTSYAPPSPYAQGVKTLQAGVSKSVN